MEASQITYSYELATEHCRVLSESTSLDEAFCSRGAWHRSQFKDALLRKVYKRKALKRVSMWNLANRQFQAALLLSCGRKEYFPSGFAKLVSGTSF